MFSFARLRSRRTALLLAAAMIVGVGSATVTEAVAPAPVSAAGSDFLCDQNTIYGITSGGALIQINATDGTANAVVSLPNATNALGITRNGTAAFAFKNGGNNIDEYDPVTGTTTTVANADPGGNQTAIRGAVDPANNVYYYASSGTSSRLAAYNITTGTEIGQVATITGLGGSNGDMAFGTDGTLYLVDGATVYRIPSVPAVAGTVTLPATAIATLPTGTNSPGIAYSTDGYLYLAQSSSVATIYKINPSSGAQVGSINISTNQAVVDLATCNYANSLRGQADVRSRAANTDQFTITNSGNGISTGNAATTSGTATGIQAAVAGPSLTVGGATYSVTQTASGTTNLANYSVGWTCVNNTTSTTVATGTGNTASFTYPAATTSDGSDVVCTFLDAVNPVAVNDSYTTAVNTTLNVSAGSGLLANDSGTSITVTSNTAPSHGSVTVNPNGSFGYTPTSEFSGTDTFTYTITDVNGTTSTATATIHITPTAVDDTASTAPGTPVALPNLTANDHGTTLTVQSVTSPSHGTASTSNGTVTYTPTAGYTGSDSFSYTATDASGQSATATVTVTVSTAAVDDSATTPANTPVTTAVLTANDHPSTLVTQSITQPSHGSAVLQGDGTVVYTPNNNYSGPDQFTYTATDGTTPRTANVFITVTPVAVADTATTPFNTPVTVAAPISNDHATAPTITAITQPSHGSAVLTNGDVTYTPASIYSGTDTLTYTITDASNQTSTTSITITVTPTGSDDAGTTPANTTLTVPTASGVLANDHGTGLTVSAHTAPSHGTLTIAGDGSYSYVPTTGYSGPDSFQYTAQDASGQTITQTVRLTVTPTAANDSARIPAGQSTTAAVRSNDVGSGLTITTIGAAAHGTASAGPGGTIAYTPAAGYSGDDSVAYTVTDSAGQSVSAVLNIIVDPTAADDSTTTMVNTPVTVPASTLLSNDVGTSLVVTAAGQPAHGSAVLNNGGSITYTPTTGYSGPDSLQYQVTDASGRTATAQLSIIVGNAATPDTGTTPANTTLNVDAAHGVLSNDSGTGLTASLAGAPTHGTVTLNSDGSYQYVPSTGFSGTDTFSYTATDSSNQTATGLVTIHVTPRAVNDTATVASGSTLTVAAPGVLGNDVGVGLHVTTSTAPSHGTATVANDGTVSYTPTPGYSGPDSFTYTVTDAAGGTSTATVSISVTPTALPNDPTTTTDTPITVDAAHGLLVGASGSGLVASLATPPTHGTVAVNPDGSYTYTPNPGFTGTDTFTFTVTDSSNQTTSGSAAVLVVPPATAANDQVSGVAGQPVTINPLSNDSATGGSTFDLSTLRIFDPQLNTYALQVTEPGVGTWRVLGAELQFTPVDGYRGTATVRYEITDSAGTTVQATVSAVYLETLALAHTGVDREELTGMATGGLTALLLGFGLLFFAGLRRRGAPKAGPRHSTMTP